MMVALDFDKYERFGAYHWGWYEENTCQYRDLVTLTLGRFEKPGTLLDIGCGDGLISFLLFRLGFGVTGIDPNVKAIQVGRAKALRMYLQLHPWLAVAWWLTGKNGIHELRKRGFSLEVATVDGVDTTYRFDYGLCHEVIEHVPDPVGLIKATMLRVKEYAIITTPNGTYNKPKEYDYQFWTPDELLRLFDGYRAELVEVNEIRIAAKVSWR